jgi:hypothetical protein
MYHEHGSADLLIRIDVDTENFQARNAYEHGWGFEHFRTFVSDGTSYEMLVLRPEVEASDGDPGDDVGAGAEPEPAA